MQAYCRCVYMRADRFAMSLEKWDYGRVRLVTMNFRGREMMTRCKCEQPDVGSNIQNGPHGAWHILQAIAVIEENPGELVVLCPAFLFGERQYDPLPGNAQGTNSRSFPKIEMT